jgi:hypothetical protein
MTKDDIQDLLVGAVVVALGYALWRHFKPAQAVVAAPPAPTGPRTGVTVGAPSPSASPFTSLTDLLSGAVHDIGGYQGRNYLDEMADPVLQGRDSIVVQEALW